MSSINGYYTPIGFFTSNNKELEDVINKILSQTLYDNYICNITKMVDFIEIMNINFSFHIERSAKYINELKLLQNWLNVVCIKLTGNISKIRMEISDNNLFVGIF